MNLSYSISSTIDGWQILAYSFLAGVGIAFGWRSGIATYEAIDLAIKQLVSAKTTKNEGT